MAFQLIHDDSPTSFFVRVPNDAAKRRGIYANVSPADLLFWMALRSTKPDGYSSKSEVARLAGREWNIARDQVAHLVEAGLLEVSDQGWRTVIPAVGKPPAKQPEPTQSKQPEPPAPGRVPASLPIKLLSKENRECAQQCLQAWNKHNPDGYLAEADENSFTDKVLEAIHDFYEEFAEDKGLSLNDFFVACVTKSQEIPYWEGKWPAFVFNARAQNFVERCVASWRADQEEDDEELW